MELQTNGIFQLNMSFFDVRTHAQHLAATRFTSKKPVDEPLQSRPPFDQHVCFGP
jgi:hypothetical protein